MNQENGNIGWVCPNHSPKPDPKYLDKPPEWFVGKNCKLGFPTGRKEAPFLEFMWVYVTGFEGDELTGRLNNDPAFVTDYVDGDGVGFERNEICAVDSE